MISMVEWVIFIGARREQQPVPTVPNGMSKSNYANARALKKARSFSAVMEYRIDSFGKDTPTRFMRLAEKKEAAPDEFPGTGCIEG
jgi:hypothetical protein